MAYHTCWSLYLGTAIFFLVYHNALPVDLWTIWILPYHRYHDNLVNVSPLAGLSQVTLLCGENDGFETHHATYGNTSMVWTKLTFNSHCLDYIKPQSLFLSVTWSVYHFFLYSICQHCGQVMHLVVTLSLTDPISIRHPVPTPTSIVAAIGLIRQGPQCCSMWPHLMLQPVLSVHQMCSDAVMDGVFKHANSYSSTNSLICSPIQAIGHRSAGCHPVAGASKIIKRWYSMGWVITRIHTTTSIIT